MKNYILRRLGISILILLGVTLINFFIIYFAPGSPIDYITNPHASEAVLEAKKAALGLNQPISLQYAHWLKNAVGGNFGTSFSTHESVASMVAERIGPTLLLMGTALLVGLAIAIPLGMMSAYHQYTLMDYLTIGTSFVGISIPNFFFSLGLVYLFALQLRWLPTSGMTTMGDDPTFMDTLRHLILPATVIAINVCGRTIRYVRSSTLEVLHQDYLRTARAKGLQEGAVIRSHAFRNILIPLITLIGMEIPLLFGGAVITEKVFSWPGLGLLMMNSILKRDYPVIMALNLIVAVSVVASNFLVDLLYVWIDPRVKFAAE